MTTEKFQEYCALCSRCNAIVDLIFPGWKFCKYCGQELSLSLRFRIAMREVEREDREQVSYGPCDSEYHYGIVLDNRVSTEIDKIYGGNIDSDVKFCPVCGKKLPLFEDLPQEWQVKLEKEIARHKKMLETSLKELLEDDEE